MIGRAVAALAALTVGSGSALLAAPAAESTSADARLAGHYYLSGVMETGSELLLRPDRTFDWYLSYGAVDQIARGTWRRDGDAVLLTAASPERDKPLFAFAGAEPWSAEVEQMLLSLKREADAAALRARCPSLGEPQVTVVPAPPLIGADGEQAQQPAAAPADEEDGAAADVPEGCSLPDPVAPSESSADWSNGLGVQVADLRVGSTARNVRVTLHFADGRHETVITAAGGLAFLRDAATAAATGATVEADYAPGREARLTFEPIRSGLIHISIDTEQLVQPPFTTLRLRIKDDALIAEEFGGARYERGR